MDIEKLKSIIRLANNNPNENEANLAARKACKILAENDFATLSGRSSYNPSEASAGTNSGQTKPKGRPAPNREPEQSVNDIFEEMFRAQRAAEAKRREKEKQRAEEAKRRAPSEPKNSKWNPFYGFDGDFNPFKTRDESEFRRTWVNDPDIFEQETKERQEQKQKRDKELYQRCSRCRNMGWGPKHIYDLYRLGSKEFICHQCLGTQYKKTDSSYKKSETKKKCPRCQADIYYDFKEKVYICDNIICGMRITEQEWVNIGK